MPTAISWYSDRSKHALGVGPGKPTSEASGKNVEKAGPAFVGLSGGNTAEVVEPTKIDADALGVERRAGAPHSPAKT